MSPTGGDNIRLKSTLYAPESTRKVDRERAPRPFYLFPPLKPGELSERRFWEEAHGPEHDGVSVLP